MARAAARFVIAAALAAVCMPSALAGQENPGAVAALPDSVRSHLDDGRYWRASLALRAHLEPLEAAPLAARMVLADAEAGWKNWNGAVAALAAGSLDTAQAPPRVWYLLGISRGAAGDGTGAAADFQRFLAAVGTDSRETVVAGARLAVLLAEGVSPEEAVPALEELRTRSPVVAGWAALAVARAHAREGRAEAVPGALALIADPAVRRRGWSLESDAWAAAGDTAAALEALVRAEAGEDGGAAPPRVPFLSRQWRYRLALGDSAGAVDAMEALLRETTSGAAALAAAKAHWRVARNSGPDILRLVARAHANGGEFGTAAVGWRLVAERGGVLTERDALARARAYTGSGALDAAITAYRPLAESDDPAIAATALQEWASVRARQGRHGDARTVQGWLVERYPASSGALDVIFLRADNHQDAGRLDDAIEHYGRVVSMSSGADRAGLSRMRWAQIHLGRDEPGAAADVYAAYLEEFPNGRRWEEASYWGARAAQAAGDTARAVAWLDRLRRESPYSYYAFLAGRGGNPGNRGDATAVGADPGDRPAAASPFGPPPQGCLVPPPPDWLARQLEALATLREAGLDEGAEAHIDAMRTAVWDSDELLLRLGTALNEAGYTIDGIRMGWELRDRGREWDCALLRVVYPFPYRDLLTSRAEELGLDPWLVAGLVRQESAFHPTIVSPAGAIGLMQVMPATGRQLARASGVRDFTTQTLENAEVNVHLGTRFLAELFERYDGDVPLFLSAYNAGPTRANRWRRMPEAADPERFTERIPFAETRGYVKNVTRNRALYRWLYGGGG
ncbi:MAG: transglycosylase SLT domain-containing protein [Gemmatimonadota bacterium]|nr:transglycosylase SLT domain-containing protein [Gemmatimonadota bacterium]